MDLFGAKFIEEGLWLTLDGLTKSSNEKDKIQRLLKKYFDNALHSTARAADSPTSTSGNKAVSHDFQAVWLAAKLWNEFSLSASTVDGAILFKRAQCEYFITELMESRESTIAKELFALMESTVSSLSSPVLHSFTLSSQTTEFLQNNLLKNTLISLGLIRNLLSPCIPHLADNDATLTALCVTALNTVIAQLKENCDNDKKGTLLLLLSTAVESCECLTQIKALVDCGALPESDVHLALVAKGGSPPQFLHAFCELENPEIATLFSNDGQVRSKEAFQLQNVSGQHWLLNLLDFCYGLILKDKHMFNQVLSLPPMSILSPLLLFTAWDQQLCEETAVSYLSSVCTQSNGDPIFQRLGFLLERRAIVVKWVKYQNKKENALLESNIISKLQNHSTLRVLHESGCLNNSDWTEVQKLLDKANLSNNESNWESTLFQGYCIMTSIMNLIWTSVKIELSHEKSFPKSNLNRKMTSQDSLHKSCVNFKTKMLHELNKLRDQIEQLYPLPFRLEILENLFSLIFLRYEDIRLDEATSDSGGEDEDDSWKQSSSILNESQLTSSAASQTSSPTIITSEKVLQLPTITNEIAERETKTDNQINRGFMCSPTVIRNILECLRECLVDCTAAFYKQHGIVNVDDNTPDSNFQKRINTLTQYTTEAWWRLQLLTDLPEVPNEKGISLKRNFIPVQQRGYPSSASSSDSDTAPAEERRRLERAQRRLSHSSKQSRSDHTDRSSESSSNTTGAGSVASSGGLKMGRRRMRAQKCLPHECDSILRLMLANPTSLALLCLARKDFKKTNQVIQTFQLSKSTLASEARFLEAYETMSQDIPAGPKMLCTERDYSFSPLNENSTLGVKLVVSSSLETVRKAASAAISAANVTSQVEKILSIAPEIPGFDKYIADQHSNHLIAGLSGAVMAACDLALTLGTTRDSSISLMDVVSQHWSPTFQSIKTGSQDKGLHAFMVKTFELFRCLSKISKEDSEHGLLHVLNCWNLPLTIPLLKDHTVLWSTLQESLPLFHEKSLADSKLKIMAMRKMIKTCSVSYPYCESRGLVNSGLEPLIYFKQLFSYLQTFSSLVTKSCDQVDSGNFSLFSVLSEGWAEILGRLIFDLEAPLGHIERVAAHLQLDLLHATVSACCPRLQLFKSDFSISGSHLPSVSAWGKISLNASSSQNSKSNIPSTASPGELASSLLNDLINALQACCTTPIISHEDIITVSHDESVHHVLNETTKLSNVDLNQLTQNYDRIAFLSNTANLLFLHGLIVLGPNWGLVSRSWSEKRSAFNGVGYHIGQMGFVPLSGLLKQLFGQDEEQFLSVQEINEHYWEVQDKRVMFVLSQGTIHSPILQVLEGSQARSQLDVAVTNYVAQSVRVEGSISEGCFALIIPPLILHYLGLSSPSSLDQAEEARDEPCVSNLKLFKLVTHLARDCASNLPSLLAFLQSYASGQLQHQLSEWADVWNSSEENNTELIVTVEEPGSKFGIVLPSPLEILSSESMQSSYMIMEEEISANMKWETRRLTHSITQYLEHHCWLVGLLATRLHQESEEFKQTDRTECLDRLLRDYLPALAPLGNGNIMLAALEPWIDQYQTLWPVLDKLLSEQRESECARLILALPEASILSDVKLQTFKDLLFYHMASQPRIQGIESPWRLALSLGTSELRAQCVLNAIRYWPGTESIDTLKTVLGEPTLNPSTRNQIENALHKVTIYQQVHQVLCYYKQNKVSTFGGWHEVCKLSETDPGQVLQSLIDAKQFRLCLPWADLHGIPHRAQHLVDSSFLALLLETETTDFSHAERLLSSVPVAQAISICRRLLGSLTNIASLQFVAKFALESCISWLEDNPLVWARLQLWGVGLGILAILPEQEQTRDRSLASQPHLLLEQLLMNTRLSTLSSALHILRTANLSALPSDSPAHPTAVDAMLRQYATKALDFRVARRAIPEVKTPVDQDELLQSLSTGSTGSGPVAFVMPLCAPTKEQWVPNDEVTECMCCLAESFSMFNRRHHCRRCGRVVCGSCSNHRARVEGYGDLPVRVCDDCNHQMRQGNVNEEKQNLTTDPSSISSQETANSIEWRLFGEELHDNTAREEFGFEHAPSVALCLSILGLHSEHAAAQPRFLLEAADRMLLLLVPPTPGFVNPELDYGLVIRMARSLVVAAKVRYAKAALNSGVAHCDRLLGQVDLLALLVRSGCAAMLPVEALPLGGHALRHLRDRLVASELWPLALEVSTKAGLERGGVWAAWGKACLRAGRWAEAREHFVHCLQAPMSPQDPSPAPLLSEIIRILEETSYFPDSTVMKQAEHISAPAFSVLHSLAALKDISQGKFQSGPAVNSQPLFYSESQYYLRTYGSHAATLAFFISHLDLSSALNYAKERRMEPDVFAESLYKPCLRLGLIGKLHDELKNSDASLEVWKKTLLHVGRVLERQGLLNSLYQLQLYTQDLVRASMTCIRFYCTGARCYTDLTPEHLHRARSHLEEELASVTTTQWPSGSKGRDSESPASNAPDSPEILPSSSEIQLPLKLPARQLDHHISTICRQLEAAKFLQQCESEGRSVVGVAADLNSNLESGTVPPIPTLFGNSTERAHLSALVILCGKNVEEGFGITFRIIQDFRLRAPRIYSIAAQWLTSKGQISHIEQLISCIRSSGSMDSATCSDELLLQCVHQLAKQNVVTAQTENLLRLIMDPGSKVQAHIACGHLKSAYLLAVKLGRASDVRAVLSEADRLNQPIMRRICTQWLAQQQKHSK